MLLKTKKQDFDNLSSDQAKTEETVNDFQKINSSLEREISQLKTAYKALENAANTKQKNVNSVGGGFLIFGKFNFTKRKLECLFFASEKWKD